MILDDAPSWMMRMRMILDDAPSWMVLGAPPSAPPVCTARPSELTSIPLLTVGHEGPSSQVEPSAWPVASTRHSPSPSAPTLPALAPAPAVASRVDGCDSAHPQIADGSLRRPDGPRRAAPHTPHHPIRRRHEPRSSEPMALPPSHCRPPRPPLPAAPGARRGDGLDPRLDWRAASVQDVRRRRARRSGTP